MTNATSIPATLDPKVKDDLRDRAAYVYATGTLPTHLRSYMTGILSKITRTSRKPTAFDQRGGTLAIAKKNAQALGLDDHPMVKQVRDFVNQGYNIQVSRGLRTRRPFGKVFMWRRDRTGALEHITVQNDGSVLNRW
jgi:hypothetical protein